MHRCNFIIMEFEKLAGMFLNTFHRDKDFKKKKDKIIAKNRSKTFQVEFNCRYNSNF